MAQMFLPIASILGVFLPAHGSDPLKYLEPEDLAYWSSEPGAVPPFDAPRRTTLTRKEFDELILDGQVFVVPGLSHDWPMRTWDCDFFKNDPEFKRAAMTHQYGGHREARLGDNWQNDKTSSGAKNETAPQVAPFYWGIKDVQHESQPGWTRAMLARVARNTKVPPFMHPSTAGSFARTPEFWFGTGSAGAKAHMDSHVQATLSLQIAGTKRWRLMPLRQRRAPFLAMLYSDGQPYENDEGWKPIFDITLQPGDALFFPPGMIHETNNIGDVCASSVTFQFWTPFAARFYRRYFPRVRRTADIGESWPIIHDWARLGMPGDQKGKGAPYDEAKNNTKLDAHFKKLDADGNRLLSAEELNGIDGSHDSAINYIGWHDTDGDENISLEEFKDGFAFWSAITHQVIEATPKEWRKFQLFGTIENLEDIPPKLSKKMRKAALREEARVIAVSMSSKPEL